MNKRKESKSEAECGEGRSCSSNTGGGIKETCIIHFPDVNASNTIVSLSNIENPSERLEKLNYICRRRLLEPQGSVQRITDICSQIFSTCYQRFTGYLHRLQASASLRQNLLHHERSADHLLRNTSPQNVFFVAMIASVRLSKVAYGVQNYFPNSNTVEEPQYLK